VKWHVVKLIVKLENVAIANALQLEAARGHVVPIRLNFVACAKFEVTQPVRCRLRAFFLLIFYVTLWSWTLTSWPWPLTPWPCRCIVDGMLCDQSMYQIWARSVISRLSYWRLTTDFSSVFEGAPILPGVILKAHWAICTKPGRDIVRSSLHAKFKNGEYLARFPNHSGSNSSVVERKAQNHTFWPLLKIRGGLGEISGSMIVAVPMIEPPIYIWWAALPRLLSAVVR